MEQAEQALTVFTVDDSEIVFKNMGSFLSATNGVHWLGHAFSLKEAFEGIENKSPQLVILDIQLREDSTFKLLEYINKNFPHVIVIMFTNLSTEPYRRKCENLGAKYFLDKSCEFEKIPVILNELLETRLRALKAIK